MKAIIIKILGLALIFTAFVACSDDDDGDNTPVVNDVMVVYNRDTGMFSSINTTNGTLTTLGTITFDGQPLLRIRDVVYNPGNSTIYACLDGSGNAEIYSVDPTTLVATVINDNADEDWDAVMELEIVNGKLLGIAYLYNPEYSHGLIVLNLDGTQGATYDLMYDGVEYDTYGGMGMEFGSSSSQLLIADDDDTILVSNLTGVISEVIDLTYEGFPMDEGLDRIKCLEKDGDGKLFAVDNDGHFLSIDITTGVATYISTLVEDDNKFQALTYIPETVFE